MMKKHTNKKMSRIKKWLAAILTLAVVLTAGVLPGFSETAGIGLTVRGAKNTSAAKTSSAAETAGATEADDGAESTSGAETDRDEESAGGAEANRSEGTDQSKETGQSEETDPDSEGGLEDGTYSLSATIKHASQNQASMGNNALKNPVYLIVKDGVASIYMELTSMTIGSGDGYLGDMYYFPSYTEESQPSASKKQAVEVDSYFQVVDAYNHPTSGADANLKGKNYPHILHFPVEAYQKIVWIQIYVPIMEAISSGNGTQFARIVPDWDSLEKISGETAFSSVWDEAALEGYTTSQTAVASDDTGDTEEPSSGSGTSKTSGSTTGKKSSTGSKTSSGSTKSKTSSGSSKTSSGSTSSTKSSSGSSSSGSTSGTTAVTGKVYTCTINRSYKHPVTGAIEDSGGTSAAGTGQGMAESAVASKGILEETSKGILYLTIRLSLMDYTSGHSIKVQSWGSSGWKTPTTKVTKTGSDSNGTTKDCRFQIPSKKSVIRISMYVTPMGRNVIFYIYPSSYTEGNSTDMTATVVTAKGEVDTGETAIANAASVEVSSGTNATADSLGSTLTEDGEESELFSDSLLGTDGSAEDGEQSSLLSGDLGEAAGLTLSTQGEAEALSSANEQQAAEELVTQGQFTMGQQILINVLSIVISGVILMFVAAGIIYLFIKNRRRWFPDARDADEA